MLLIDVKTIETSMHISFCNRCWNFWKQVFDEIQDCKIGSWCFCNL